MATSGSYLTSDSGQGDSLYYGRMQFVWERYDWGRTSTRGYHKVRYLLRTYGGVSTRWQYFYQGSMNFDGTGRSFSSPTKAYSAGATTFGWYYKTLYTNSSGDRSFGVSAQGGIFYNTINTSGSRTYHLNNIPMYGKINSLSPNSGLTDETSNLAVSFTKYTGRATLWFRLDQINNSDTTHRKTNVSSTYNWSGFNTWLRQSMVNTNSTTLYIYYGDDLNSNGNVDNYRPAVTRTITIKNDQGQANPTFNDFDYLDTNSVTTAITGDNQILIQGKSTLQTTVTAANKATPNKEANMSSYVFSIGGYSQSSSYSSSVDVVRNMGTVSDVSGNRTLSVRAIDSRQNSKTVNKNVQILPYSSPRFSNSLNVRYTNDFDITDGITVNADSSAIASISPLIVSSLDKNSVDGTSGVQFDVSKNGNNSYTGTWENISTTQTSGTGSINATLATIASDIATKINGMGADNTVVWFVKFRITDELETTEYEVSIDIGRPIFRIGTDGKLYHNEVEFHDEFGYNPEKRFVTTTSASTLTPDIDNYSYYRVTSQVGSITVAAPTGTPYDGQGLLIEIHDNGTSHPISWNAAYTADSVYGLSLPTVTTSSRTHFLTFVWRASSNKWIWVA